MSTPETNLFDEVDALDAEYDAPAPTPEPEEPTPEPVAAEPAPSTRERDAATGQFVPQPPAAMPDPVKAADEPQRVPLPVLLEERREFKRELAERDQRLRDLEARLKNVETPAVAAAEPDFLEDPKAYVDAKVATIGQRVEQTEQTAQAASQEQMLNRFLSEVGTVEAAFVKTAPDYYDALAHVRQARSTQLLTMFPQATPAQVQQQIKTEELQAAAALMQQGRNPSEVIYQVAKDTYGYRPRTAAAPAAAAPAAIPAPPSAKVPVADPGSTLGSTGGAADPADEDEMGSDDTGDMIVAALKERFRR